MIQKIINWFKELERKRIEMEKEKMDNWNNKPNLFKIKFRCINCKYIFVHEFKEGESIHSKQDWRGHFAYLYTDCPNREISGFIKCPLCNMDECRVVNTNQLKENKKEAMEIQILP